jgi:hypothetical protein
MVGRVVKATVGFVGRDLDLGVLRDLTPRRAVPVPAGVWRGGHRQDQGGRGGSRLRCDPGPDGTAGKLLGRVRGAAILALA